MTRRILTGDRPTGRLHLGHYVGTLANRVALQSKYDMAVMVADIHALSDHGDNPEYIRKLDDNIRELILDYLAVGINPEKTIIFLQSATSIPAIFSILMNFATIARCERLPALKEKIKDQDIKHPSMGLLNYPILQAADILSMRAHLVPVGKDQEAHVEFAREIAHTFNRLYSVAKEPKDEDEEDLRPFPEPEVIIGEIKTLPGIDGQKKMSKSLDNAIYLSDEPDVVEKKVMKMYTDPKRTSANVPGAVEGNPVFMYHEIFNKDTATVDKMAEQYKKGKIGDVEVKKELVNALNTFLNPIRFRRKNFEEQEGLIDTVLEEGTQRARVEIDETLSRMRKALGFREVPHKDPAGLEEAE